MTQMTDESVDPADLEGYRALGALLGRAARLYGVAPKAVEEKAALEARRAAEAITVNGVSVPWTGSESRWTEGKMEIPGVQQWEFRYVLQLDVTPRHAEAAFAQVQAFWTERGLDIDYWDPAVGVFANPGKGSWALTAGLLDEASIAISVTSGIIQTSSNPLGTDERES